MLQWIRDNSRHAIIYFLFLILIAMFVYSLAGGGRNSGPKNPNTVSVVYDQAIDRKTFDDELRDRERQYENMLGDKWTDEMARQLGLPQQALAALENRVLMQHGAKALGLQVTDTELKDRVVSVPAFLNNGVFDYERYKRVLAYQRRTPKQFEEALRQDLLVQKMQEFLAASVHVSREEALSAWRNARETLSLDYVALDLAPYRRAAAPTEAEVRAFAAKQGDAIRRYYDTHVFEYKRPAQVHASHILLAIPAGAPAADQAKVQARAEALAAQARRPGADFARLARENSADPGSRDKGGDLGWLSPGQTVKPFDEAIFGAKEKSIVGPVKTQFGWHIILVQEKRPALERKFDEVKDEIARKLATDEQATASAGKDARALLEQARKAKDLASLTLPRGATRATTQPFTRDAIEVPGLGASGTLVQTAFALTPEAPVAPDVVTVGDKLAVLRLHSRTPAPANPSEKDLVPVRERLLATKRQLAVALWLQGEREQAEKDKAIARNQEVLKDYMGG